MENNWICNSCNFPNFTGSVSQDEIDQELQSCINCGGFEFHKNNNMETNKEIPTAEKLFLEKYGNKITASESWVIRFSEEYAKLNRDFHLSKQAEEKEKQQIIDAVDNMKEKIIDANDPKFLLSVLQNIERGMPKTWRKRFSNVVIVRDYLMAHTNKGGKTSSYEMCIYLDIDGDAYTFFENQTFNTKDRE